MNTTFLHEIFPVNIIYGNNDLFPKQALCSHVDTWFGLAITFDHLLNILCLEGGKSFLDFKYIFGIITCPRGLYI